MDIASTPNANNSAPTDRAVSPERADNKGAIASDFDTFLKMLTAQIENQDPLNPMDSTDFATQLATFSAVEQQTLTNEILREIRGEPGLEGLATHAHWIGREIAHTGPVSFEGKPVKLALDVPPEADRHSLSIATADGLDLGTVPLASTSGDVDWSGQLPGGSNAVPGDYVLTTISTMPDGTKESRSLTSYAEVHEIRSVEGRVQAVLSGGQMVPADTVTAVRTR